MRKILVSTSIYLPRPSANGINTKYIIDELKQRKYDVKCIGVKRKNEKMYEVIEETPIYRVEPSFFSRMMEKNKSNPIYITILVKFFRKMKVFFMLPFFPKFDIMQNHRVYKQMEKLYLEDQYDCIISTFKPYSNIAAMIKMKAKYPNIICIGYYLDILTNIKKPKLMPNGLYDWLIKRENIRSIDRLDLSLVAVGGKALYSGEEFMDRMHKIRFVDFPTFIPNIIPKMKCYKDETRDKVVISYAGTLDIDFRNPEFILKILKEASEKIGLIELNIYGANNCYDLFQTYQTDRLIINDYGIMPHNTILNILKKSDFVLNISNKIQNAIPSKIFELFSIGKPIINLLFDSMDITIPYFEKYPKELSVKAWENIRLQTELLLDFMRKNQGACIDPSILTRTYERNMPSYTVDIIEEILKNALGYTSKSN